MSTKLGASSSSSGVTIALFEEGRGAMAKRASLSLNAMVGGMDGREGRVWSQRGSSEGARLEMKDVLAEVPAA